MQSIWLTLVESIDFDATLSGQIISLTLGQLVAIDKDLIIDGSGLVAHVQISGNNAVRVFSIPSGVIVTLNQLDIINGLGSVSSGGGIESYGELTLNDCTLSDNSADWGGGIFSAGILSVNRCTVSDNTATGNGGGILNEFGGTLTVNDSTFTGAFGAYSGASATRAT